MFSRILFVAAVSMGAAACVGDVAEPGTGGTGSDSNTNNTNSTAGQLAKKSFEDTVYPVISTTCGGCHQTQNPAFVAGTKDASYAQAVDFSQVVGNWTTDSAGIYKVPTIAAHATITKYTADQQKAIADWLALEVAARATTGGGTTLPGEESPGLATTRLTKAFQSCMALTDFNTAQAGTRMANQQSTEGSCNKCHQSGQGSMIANDVTNPDLLPMFGVLKSNAYFFATYFTVNVAAKPYKVVFNDAAFTRVAGRKFPHQDHPQFSVTGNNAAGLTAMKDFMTKTVARLDPKGDCPTPQQ
jgi:predicted metal-binding protein